MSQETNKGNDERLRKASGPATRGDRESADKERTEKDGTALTREERMKMIRNEWSQDVLPQPPQVPGWHYCWLSTTNATDPIYKRVQRGYEPVKVSDIPAFAQYRVTQGEFEGCVACNEMLLFRIEEELYQETMKYFHYEKPLEEEELLKANLPGDDEDKDGKQLGSVEGAGFEKIARRVRAPSY